MRVCYFTNWAQYRHGTAKFVPENIDPFLCTHIVYSFAKLVDDSIEPYEWNDEDTEWSKGLYTRTMNLKTQNPNLKILLALGGWNHGSSAFSKMANNDFKRNKFVENTVEFLKKNRFDGLDFGECSLANEFIDLCSLLRFILN